MMANDRDKNFDELLARFYNEADARQVKDDIKSGDKLFASFPGPAPSAELIGNIKAAVNVKLSRRPRRIYYRAAAVAAVVAALIIIAVNLLPSTRPSEIPPVTMTADADTALDNGTIFGETDMNLDLLSAEFEQIETSLLALRLEETENSYDYMADSIDDIETKLIEIETVFWKG